MKEANCREVIENLFLLLDGELDATRCDDLQAHIERCIDCLGRVRVERRFKELLRERCAERHAPETLLHRIRLALRRETAI